MDSSASARDMTQYDVFLSFRGKDTRRGIVSHLHNALVGRINDIFKDDETLVVGDNISEEIKEAIRHSKFAIVVISANFVTSTWCLNELQMIMELHKKGQLNAIPIFYEIDPSDVKHQRGTFSLKRYKPSRIMRLLSSEKRKKAAQVRKWREVLTQVGGTSGMDSRACADEATMVEDIVNHIARESRQPIQMGDLFGMDAHMAHIDPLLDMDSTTDEVRIIGIWGMGGIGKTTIATYLYNKYSSRFAPWFCFVKDIRHSTKDDLPRLQQDLLSTILGKKQATILSTEHGCTLIKSKLKKLKVLLVLDDVVDMDQLRALAKETSWFGPGSRIIITTRDSGLLNLYGQKFVHHVNFLGNDDSVRVFKQVAFDGGLAPSDVYEQLSIRASKLARGLPSALNAFGTNLRQMNSTEAWKKTLVMLEKYPQQSIMNIFRTSYDRLDKRDQAVFLHLACLFNGDTVHHVAALFDDGYMRIKCLEKQSLVDISPDGCITMHILVEQAGREIVLQESKFKFWRQRILWEHEDIVSVLQNTTGTTTTEGVALHMCEMDRIVPIDGGILNAMNNVKFFKAFTHLNDIQSNLKFLPHTDKLPKTLRLLHWDAYPMTTLPNSDYHPSCLVELNLRYSNLVRIWDGNLGLNQLKRLDVSGSKNLTDIPDLSRATRLEELIMKGCTRLKQIPESIGSLSCLRKLDLSHCDGLMNLQIHISEKTVLSERGPSQQIILELPGAIKKLTSLADLSIEGEIHIELLHLRGSAHHFSCVSKQQIPDELMVMPNVPSMSNFKHLSIKRFSYSEYDSPLFCVSFSGFPCLAELNLINLNIQKIPEDIGLLQSLEKLDMSGNDFRNLPISMNSLSNLKYLRLSNCINLKAIPEMTELQTLKLSGCSNLKSLLEPSHLVQEICSHNLLELDLANCKYVHALSDQLSHFTNLIILDLSSHDFESIPESIRELSSLGTLYINNCKKLKSVEELPQNLKHLYAHGCDSLENVALSPSHSIKHIDLSHCFNLQQYEDLISRFLNDGFSQEVSPRFLCLPGDRVPVVFDNRSHGTLTKIRLNSIRFTPTILGFAACTMISCKRSFNLRFSECSYDWNYEADEVIQINLKPDLYRSSEIEEEETVPLNHQVIIHVRSNINTERIEDLRLECNLQHPEEFQFPPAEINTRGNRILDDDYTNYVWVDLETECL